MSMTIDLLLGSAASALAGLVALALLRRDDRERDAASGLGRELAANALGILLVGSLAAGSGLFVDALCRIVQSQG